MTTQPAAFLAGKHRPIFWIVLLAIFSLALSIRLDDLSDLPADTVRPLHSARIARGMYYQGLANISEWEREFAIALGKTEQIIEPPILEALTAATYRMLGREELWIAGFYSLLLWTVAGIPLFLLAKELTSAVGALVSLAFYLFLPYAIEMSRSFQPDPLMVAALIFALWALARWGNDQGWRWALLFGILAGLAIFIKAVAIFPILGAWIGLLIGRGEFKKAIRQPQIWVIGALALLPAVIYYFYGSILAGFLSGQSGGRFIPAMLIQPLFYIRWELKAAEVVGQIPIFLGLLGLLFFDSVSKKGYMIGLWGGYILYGLTLPHHIASHPYYHLPLVPIVALSLAPLADTLFRKLDEKWNHSARVHVYVSGLLLAGLVFISWEVHVGFKGVDYRGQIAYWEEIGEKLNYSSAVIALTQDYGYPLSYWGWINARIWPSYGDLRYREKIGGNNPDFASLFTLMTAGQDFFLVTRFEEFDYQPELEQYLYNHYPIYDQGEDYLIFDLQRSINP